MISVCLASYNGERYIGEQISSILQQLSQTDELVISDDGSTDATVDIVNSFKDPRIRLIRNINRHGVNGNFENALKHSRGEIIFLSDQDDVWLIGKVEACLESLKTNYCVVHDAIITDGELNTMHDSFFDSSHCRTGFVHNWIKNGYLGCAMAFHRGILDIALPIPDNLPVWQDIWIGSLCQLKHNVAFIPYKGIKFRRHSSNTSITFKSKFTLIKKIRYRIELLLHLFKRIYLHR